MEHDSRSFLIYSPFRYVYGGPVSSLRISDDEIVSDGHCLSISDAIGRRLRDGDKIRKEKS
jgi:hypothetical protein